MAGSVPQRPCGEDRGCHRGPWQRGLRSLLEGLQREEMGSFTEKEQFLRARGSPLSASPSRLHPCPALTASPEQLSPPGALHLLHELLKDPHVGRQARLLVVWRIWGAEQEQERGTGDPLCPGPSLTHPVHGALAPSPRHPPAPRRHRPHPAHGTGNCGRQWDIVGCCRHSCPPCAASPAHIPDGGDSERVKLVQPLQIQRH